MGAPRYETIGRTYAATRREDPRIAAHIFAALGDARSVVNVGAGTGAYEPHDREVVAVEPSAVMIAQRPPGAAPALCASAERLPLPDQSVDAALAVNTLQHWHDVPAGLHEMMRVARKRVVIFLRTGLGTPFWLTSSRYLPALDATARLAALHATVVRELGPVDERAVPLPNDCHDGVFTAFWARPERYLDARVRANISNFALAGEGALAPGLATLSADLASGAWDRAHGELRARAELDLGHRVVILTCTGRIRS